MNITFLNRGIHTQNQSTGGTVFAGNLPLMQHAALKSTQDKLERQQETQNQIAYWEQQKENLKNIECNTLEEIAKKLERFHSYEGEIAAARMKYNSEQMWHVMDESRELGEKIAEEAEKMEPKTAEERREEIVEEALGIDESKGELTESMEEAQEIVEEQIEEQAAEQIEEQAIAEQNAADAEQGLTLAEQELLREQASVHKGIDILV